MADDDLPITERTRVRRYPARGHYDRETVYAILDEGFVCHLGYAVAGRPWVIPTLYGRDGDSLVVHGAVANEALRSLTKGAEVCVTVTLVDGFVLARSGFHHSANYRSVMLFGVAERIDDPEEKRRALDCIIEHAIPGRTADLRPATASELAATQVLRIPIDEASAKVRPGGPSDDEADLSLPTWAGVLPLHLAAGIPEPDALMDDGAPVPEYLLHYHRPSTR
jgi:nitroimidazol reductase NimA-like FMN-containing flavoprotein (pyridoxamine 5'-phosphate oxidase superfamily)